MDDQNELLRNLEEKGLEWLKRIQHLHKEDVDRLKRLLVKKTLDFINKRRDPDKINEGLFKKLRAKRWLKNILEFPYQEMENSTILVMGASDYHHLLGLGLNTTYVLSLIGGGMMTYAGCPFIRSKLPPRFKESAFINEQLTSLVSNYPEIDRIFLVSSFPFCSSLTEDPHWTIRHAIIWLAQAEEYLLRIIKDVEVNSFLLYNDNLCQVMTEKVLHEKNEGKIGL